ncbi:MAG: WecB/TagA/CpsF family glycosyltransferase [Eubacteriales bacterium]|nr:WecB/TagA/CpsF family glycosyltransferase [Eubacteriales bacterium]
MKKQPLLNTYVNNIDMHEAMNAIDELVRNKKKSYIVAVNVDVIMKIEKDADLKKVTDEADIVLVDGQPLLWISKWFKRPIKEKISGSDLVPRLCEESVSKKQSIFIIGGADGIAEKAKRNLEMQFSGINIVGTYSPQYGFEYNSDELEKINDIITEAHPDILIACFGCPKQEKWIYENYLKYDATVSICAGATVDFLAGNIKRAPKWMSNHGLEWFYRFLNEPKRLFKRYFIDDIKILGLMWKYRK